MTDGLRLQPELVPRPLWYVSAHRFLSRREWRLLRAEVLHEAEGRCGACGEAHERFMVARDEDRRRILNVDPVRHHRS